jgi:ATP-dependent DNA helicase DinG
MDISAQSWQLHASPLSVAEVFRRQVDETGALDLHVRNTLAVGRDFSHYTSQLGLGDAATGCYVRSTTRRRPLYVPRGLPPQQRRAHQRRRRRGASGAEGEWRACVPAVHDAARADRRASG